VLEENSMDLPELERRKRAAQQMRYGIWVVPAASLTLLPALITDEVSWPLIIALALFLYGGISLYFLGRTFERRWTDLIREKRDASAAPAVDHT
jgi:membrane protein YqaA with SNARE-associated domain